MASSEGPATRHALIVTGMHRSGTSAMARVLNLLGADLPSDLMPGVPGDNDLGFWEPLDVVAHHDRFLHAAGFAWDALGRLDESWFVSDAAERLKREIAAILERDFADSKLFVVKDPRISRLVPLWREILSGFGATPRFVVMMRHPFEVAASLEKRNAFPIEKSLLLWLWHVLEVERSTRAASRTFITYDELLTDWRRVAVRLETDLGISFPERPTSAAPSTAIDAFLSLKHRHHAAAAGGHGDEQVRKWAAAVSSALGNRAETADKLGAELDRVARELEASHESYGPVLADFERRLGAKVREVESADRQIADRDQHVGKWAHEAAKLAGQLESTRHELDKAQAALARTQERLGRAEAEATSRADRIAEVETQAEALHAQLTQVLGSRSWKATSFLRRLAAMVRGRTA